MNLMMKSNQPVKISRLKSLASIRGLPSTEKPEAILKNGGNSISSTILIKEGLFSSKYQLHRAKRAIDHNRQIKINGRPRGLNQIQEISLLNWVNSSIHDPNNPTFPSLKEIGAKVYKLLLINNSFNY